MVVIRHRGIRLGEVWFDEEPDETRIDVLRRRARREPIPDARCVAFPTLLVDLSLEDDELLAAMEKDVRYEIRRAGERDGLRVESYDLPPKEILARFENDYDRFALDKGLPPRGSDAPRRLPRR